MPTKPSRLNNAGKASKQFILRPLVEAELKKPKDSQDWKAVMSKAVQQLVADYNTVERAGVQITSDDLAKVRDTLRREQGKPARTAPQPANPMPTVNGKVSKRMLLASILKELRADNQPEDNARVSAIFNSRIAQQGITGIKLRRTDISNARDLLKVSGSNKPAPIQQPSQDPPLTLDELRKAAALLSACGKSLVRAKQMLDNVLSLEVKR